MMCGLCVVALFDGGFKWYVLVRCRLFDLSLLGGAGWGLLSFVLVLTFFCSFVYFFVRNSRCCTGGCAVSMYADVLAVSESVCGR